MASEPYTREYLQSAWEEICSSNTLDDELVILLLLYINIPSNHRCATISGSTATSISQFPNISALPPPQRYVVTASKIYPSRPSRPIERVATKKSASLAKGPEKIVFMPLVLNPDCSTVRQSSSTLKVQGVDQPFKATQI